MDKNIKKDSEKKYVVYAHINKTNGKIYIGQTSMKPEHRWNNGNGYLNNKHFYNAIQKYGWDGFEHVILHNNFTLEEANICEEELIAKYHSNDCKHGYNLRSGGLNNKMAQSTRHKISLANKGLGKGRKLSQETKDKISKATKGKNNGFYHKKHTEEEKKRMSENKKGKYLGKNNPHSLEVNQYDLQGNYITSYESITDASDKTKCSHISDVCLFKSYRDGNYTWRFAKDYCKHKKLPDNEIQEIIEKSQKGKYHPMAKAVRQYTKDNIFVKEYWGATEASQLTGIRRNYITKCCIGEQNTAGGYIWKYVEGDERHNEI